MKRYFYKVTLFLSALFMSALSHAQIISTYAGVNGSITSSGDGGAATAASCGNPNGIATDKNGNVFFTDGTNNVVRKVTSAGIISTVAGNGSAGYSGDGGAATAASLNFPQGICVDTFGNIYIADEINRVIRKVNTSGVISTVVGTGASGHGGDGGPATAATLPSAVDVAIDRNGNLYIADGYYTVRKVNTAGIISTFAGSHPFDYTGDGGRADTCGLNSPLGVDVDTFGNVYISDNQNMVIRKVNASGIISTYAGNGTGAGMGMGGSYSGDGGPATAAGLDQPYGISVSRGGDLFIADQFNSIIRYVDAATGTITKYAGNNTLAYSGDGGMADTAGINFAVDVAVDYTGNLFIADINNNVVRKVKAPYSIVINTANDTVCAGTAVTYTSVVRAPSTGYHYHWFLNSTAVGTDAGTYVADSVHTGNIIKCILIGGAGDTLAISNIITMTVIPTLAASVSFTASPAGAVCSGVPVTFTATGVNTGSAPVYHWSVNSTDVATTSTYTYTPANGDVVQVRLNSSYRCLSSAVVFSSTMVMTVTPTVTPSITIATASDTVCTSTSTIFTATIVNGGSTPHYQWFANATSIGSDTSRISYTPSSGDVISCRLTSNATCRTRDTARSNYITMVVVSATSASISISTIGGDTSCTGMMDTLVATTVHGGTSPVYAWFVNGIYASASNPFVHAPTTGDIVQCILYPSGCVTASSYSSNILTLTVLSYTTPTVSVSTSSDTVCTGGSVTFTASSTSGGTTPIYRWNKNGSYVATGGTYSDAPVSSDVYFCTLISNAHCNTTDTVSSSPRSIVVNAIVTPTITISASPSDTVCAGVAVTYTGSVTFGGSTPSYKWYKNGVLVDSSSAYSTVPANGDTITCKLVTSLPCPSSAFVMSNVIRMVVNASVTPTAVVTVSPGDTVCGSTPVSYTATVTGGGSAPRYQWIKNGTNISGATNLSYAYAPAMGDDIVFRLISSSFCAIPDTVFSATHHMIVNPIVTPSVTVTSSAGTSVCVGTSVTYTASGTGGGTASTYQWKKNGVYISGATSTTYTYTPTSGDVITCRFISNAPCRTSDSVFATLTMTVVTTGAPSVSIIAVGGDTVCVGTAVTLAPTATLGGTSPTFHWYVNGADSGVSPTFSYLPSAGDVIKCVLHSSSSCAVPDTAISNTVTISISSYVTPSVSISTPTDTVCSGLPITYTPIPVNGGYTPIYNWYVNGILMGTGSTYTYGPATGDIVKCVLHSSHPCAAPDTAISNSIVMTTVPTVVPSVTVSASPGTSITWYTPVTFTATPVGGGSSPVYVWLLNGGVVSGVSGNTYLTDTLHPGDVVTCVLLSNAPCANPPFDSTTVVPIVITNVGVVNVNKIKGAISLEPNPNNGSFVIRGTSIETADNNAQVIVTDMTGKIVYRNNVPVSNGKINTKVTMDRDLANGVYLINVKYSEGNEVLHFVIEK